MRSQKLLPIIVLGVILTVLVAPAVYGFISISNVIMANATGGGVLGLNVNSSNLTTLDNFFINVSASSIINVSNVYSNPNDQGGLNITPNGTVLEWTNQSGIAVNISPVAAFGGAHENGTDGIGNASWNLSVKFLDGFHTFKVYVWQNLTSGLSINISTLINVTVSRNAPNLTVTSTQFTNMLSNTTLNDNTPEIKFTPLSKVFSAAGVLGVKLFITGDGSATGSANVTFNATNSTQIAFNLSTLGDGFYNLTLEVSDPTGNRTNVTVVSNLRVDVTTPTGSITVTPGDGLATGSYSTISCSRADESGGSGLNATTLSLTVKDSAGTTKTITTGDIYTWNSAGDYLITCTQKDAAGNTLTLTKTISISATSDNQKTDEDEGTSLSSSASGTIAPDPTKDFDISLNLPTKSAVSKVEVDLKESATSPKVTATDFKSKPAAIKDQADPVGVTSVLQYLEIKVTVPDAAISKARVQFKVLNVSAEDRDKVALFRLVSGAWVELKTTFKEEKSGSSVFEAETPGFSYFVVAKKPSAEPLPTTSPTSSPTTSPSASPAAPAGKSSDLWLYTGIIVAIIVIVAAVVLVTKRKK